MQQIPPHPLPFLEARLTVTAQSSLIHLFHRNVVITTRENSNSYLSHSAMAQDFPRCPKLFKISMSSIVRSKTEMEAVWARAHFLSIHTANKLIAFLRKEKVVSTRNNVAKCPADRKTRALWFLQTEVPNKNKTRSHKTWSHAGDIHVSSAQAVQIERENDNRALEK